MLTLCWQDSLSRTLKAASDGKPPRVAVVGIGQEMRGDDAAGVLVARAVRASERVLPIEAGVSVENITPTLRDFQPDLVLFVDAVQMEQSPGSVAWVDVDSITGMSASTHSLPLDLIAEYLMCELGCRVGVLGIQFETFTFGAPVSPAVARAVSAVARGIEACLDEVGSYQRSST